MLIVCPHCGTSYRVTSESLGDTGRSVRCVSCHGVWFEQPHQLPATAWGSEPIDPALIRPPLNDVVDIGEAEAELADDAAPAAALTDTEFRAEPVVGTDLSDDAPSIVPVADP